MNRIVGVELSHQKAPLAIREKINFSKDELADALTELRKDVPEVFMVSTCNRLAIYAISDDLQPILDFFRKFGPLDPYLSVFDTSSSAIRHLFSTASGLESQALGEHEILGQIKKSYAQAQEQKTIGAVMDEFVRKAIFVGKKVRKETAIGQYPVSLASVSYELIREIYKAFNKLHILVLGTGEMSSLMMKILSKKDFEKLYVASRTPSRAQSMAHLYNGEAVALENISELLPDIDVIIGATHTQDYVLRQEDVAGVKTRDITFIDLGLPRNFDPDLKQLARVKLYDLDDLKAITFEGMQKRQEEVPKALNIVEQEMNEFTYWLNTRQISPVISSYYEKLEQIRQEELGWALPKLGNLDENQQKIIENLISRVTRRMSGKPIERLRDFSQQPHVEKSPIDTFKELFDL